MRKTFLLIMLVILLVPCFVIAEEVGDNKKIEEENIEENNITNSNEKTIDLEDDTVNKNTNKALDESNNSEETTLIPNARSGILMDATTGEIIFEKNKDEKLAVASMTKMVAQIIILESIESGKIKWNDIVTASANASGMGGSQIYLTTGEEMTVEDMMKGISMASANDVVVTKKQSQVIREEIII